MTTPTEGGAQQRWVEGDLESGADPTGAEQDATAGQAEDVATAESRAAGDVEGASGTAGVQQGAVTSFEPEEDGAEGVR